MDKNEHNECFTCGARMHWKLLDCGHHFHRKLDYDLRNLRPQCSRCNRWLHGNLGVYAARLIEENGLSWYTQLKRDAQQIQKYTEAQLKQLIKERKK